MDVLFRASFHCSTVKLWNKKLRSSQAGLVLFVMHPLPIFVQGLERVLNTRYLSVDFIQHVIEAVAKQLQSMSKNISCVQFINIIGDSIYQIILNLFQFCSPETSVSDVFSFILFVAEIAIFLQKCQVHLIGTNWCAWFSSNQNGVKWKEFQR